MNQFLWKKKNGNELEQYELPQAFTYTRVSTEREREKEREEKRRVDSRVIAVSWNKSL